VVAIVFPWSLTGGNGVQAEWEPDELIDTWTLVKSDWELIANKAGVTRLGFAVMLKFYEIEVASRPVPKRSRPPRSAISGHW
jgi:hypothetical protein